jgi:23S rRNA pseudouridine2605 synthase
MQERLQKIIAAAGVASRRAAEEMILRGEVTVNGRRVTELGTKADPDRDHIKVRGRLLNPQLGSQKKSYILVNKPRGYLSSVSDPRMRPLVMDLVPAAVRRGLHPVGRLDFNTEGLIILTNDGDLTRHLTQAGAVEKVYHVKVKGSPAESQIARLRRGVTINGSRTAPASVELMERTGEGGNSWYEVTLKEGKNQQIRKMFDLVGHSVMKLRRVSIGHVTDAGLPVGHYREMTDAEVRKLIEPAAARGRKPSRPARAKPGGGRRS